MTDAYLIKVCQEDEHNDGTSISCLAFSDLRCFSS
jgi:hypothetical protein